MHAVIAQSPIDTAASVAEQVEHDLLVALAVLRIEVTPYVELDPPSPTNDEDDTPDDPPPAPRGSG